MRSIIKTLQGARLHLSLSKTRMHLAYTPHSWRPKAVALFDGVMDAAPDREPAALAAALAPVLDDRRYRGAALSVTFSDEWVRLFMVAPPKNTFRLQDVRTAAALRFHTLYGDDAAAWRITCDDAFDRQFLACAMPTVLFSSIENLAAAYGLRLVSLTPTFVATWNRVNRRLGQAWFGIVHEETVVIGCVDAAPKPQLSAVQRLRLPAEDADGAWLADQLRGMALRHGLDSPKDLKLYGRYVPGLTVPAHDTGLAVTWPERMQTARPKNEPRIDLPGLGDARA